MPEAAAAWEWSYERDEAKSLRNVAERNLPFDLPVTHLGGPIGQRVDLRRDYGEARIAATGVPGCRILTCAYRERGRSRRIISLRYANMRERDAYRAKNPG